MTDPSAITTDVALVGHVAQLVGPAVRRRTWLLLFDHDDRPLPVVIPIDQMPQVPDQADIAQFVETLRMIVGETSAASVALVWERPGAPTLTHAESEWVGGVDRAGGPVRAQLLSSDRGVRLLVPTLDLRFA